MSEWFDTREILPDPDTKVEVAFDYVGSFGVPAQIGWPCTFHPPGHNPPAFVFRSWLGEYKPSVCGRIVAWRFPPPLSVFNPEQLGENKER